MICERSQIFLNSSTRQKHQQKQQLWKIYKVDRQAAKKAWKTAQLISTPHAFTPNHKTHTRTQTHTKTESRVQRMAGQKRDDCSQCAMGLVALLEKSGCIGPYFSTPSFHQPALTCLAARLSLCGTASALPSLTHRHTTRALSSYQKRKAALFAQTVSCSNFRCEQLVFRPCEGDFHTELVPRDTLMHMPEGRDLWSEV